MKYPCVCSLLLTLTSFNTFLLATDNQPSSPTAQTHVPAKLWNGLLMLQNAAELEPSVSRTLQLLLGQKERRTGYAAAANAVPVESVAKLFEASEAYTQMDVTLLFAGDAATLAKLPELQLLWIDVDEASAAVAQAMTLEARKMLISSLRKILVSGNIVCVSGHLQWLSSTDKEEQESLLEQCAVNSDPGSTTLASLMQLNVPEGAGLAISQRQAVGLSDTAVRLVLPKTEHYAEPLVHSLQAGDRLDWVQQTRAYYERLQPMFPSAVASDHQLAGGSLVIVGGGGMPREVWQKFVDLAGGENARIVILPTAVPDPPAGRASEHRLLKNLGAGEVITLPQVRREEVSSEKYLSELDRATGIWFGGGRQWHFVDAYWGTPAWQKIIDVCKRGGVIGGSSAGATIQGDVLVRGAPAGNQIMLAEGYRHGLGLLPGVAIDQHFAQRNRFRDLESCLSEFPAVYGIGIDEQTALIVTAPNACEVMGTGSVWCYPSSKPARSNSSNDEADGNAQSAIAARAASRLEYPSGSKFTLTAP